MIRWHMGDKTWHDQLGMLKLERWRVFDKLYCRLHAGNDVVDKSHKFDITLVAFRKQLRKFNMVRVVKIEASFVSKEVGLVIVTGFASQVRETSQVINVGQGVTFRLLNVKCVDLWLSTCYKI